MLRHLALSLILVHGPHGQNIEINANEISSIRMPRDVSQGHFAKGTQCVVIMTNGKFIATRETCDEIVGLIGRH